MKRADFADLVTCLTHDQPPRVWSLLVTVFGELAQEDGARISGALLRHLSALIGFKPEAVRVALHRLRKDGWIESFRHGRTSDYALTGWGRAQSAEASPRIYAPGPAADKAFLVVHEPGHPLAGDGAWLSANLQLTAHPPMTDSAYVSRVSTATPLPDWMSRKLCDEGVIAMAQRLDHALDILDAQTAALAQLSPCQRAVLRVLIVHDWRRIVLKTPALPDHVFPEDWAGARRRDQVFGLLQRLPRPDLAGLETAPVG